MEDKIMEVINWIAPIAAGFVTSTVLPFLIKKISMKKLEKKIDEIGKNSDIKMIQNRLDEINNQLLEMRGKKKWVKNTYGVLLLDLLFL